MSSNIEIEYVLSLKIRFNNQGVVSAINHSYLVVAVDEKLNCIEVAPIDSTEGKERKVFFRSTKTVYRDNPPETVIDKDSFVQLDNRFMLENFPGIERFRRQKDKLIAGKLNAVISVYKLYHMSYEIDETKNAYMDKAEILELNT